MMNKSIAPIVTPATHPGVAARTGSNSAADDEAGVSFSSLMKPAGADAPAPENSARPQTDAEASAQPAPQQEAAPAPGKESDAQEITLPAEGLPAKVRAGTVADAQLQVVAEEAAELPGELQADAQGASGLPGLSQSTDTPALAQQQSEAAPDLPATPVTAAHVPAVAAVQASAAPDKLRPAAALLPANNPAVELNMDPAVKVAATGSLPQTTVPQPVAGMAASVAPVPLPAADQLQNSSTGETLASAVRAAIQLAVAQTGSEGMKQSLAEGRQFLPDVNMIATRTSVETLAISFTDTLAETSLTPVASRVQVPVGQQGWGRAVGEQVMWFISNNVNSASLRLNPQHLGPLEMQVSMDGDKANVAFVSQHASVREALDSAMPRLRELFSEQGLSLGDVHVSQHGASGQQDRDDSASASLAGDGVDNGGADAADIESTVAPGDATGLGLVDYYV
ncbi:MAG: flagellar hook-length control protein FliK [Gammaproteobacteria bacterium]